MMQTSMDTSTHRYPSGEQLYRTAPLKKTYTPPFALPNIISIAVLFITFVIFMASFGESSWFVMPEGFAQVPKSFGLWLMCVRDRCVVEMTNDYMVKRYLVEYPFVIPAYEQYLMPVKILMCISLVAVILAFIANLLFLAGYATYFLEFALQLFAGLMTAISVGIFGGSFKDVLNSAPFGAAYWMAVIAAMLFIVNGLVMALISVMIFKQRGKSFSPRR